MYELFNASMNRAFHDAGDGDHVRARRRQPQAEAEDEEGLDDPDGMDRLRWLKLKKKLYKWICSMI